MKLPRILRRWLPGRDLPVWYDPSYRIPIPSLEARTGVEPRRADFVAWYLLESHVLKDLRSPLLATYEDLSRVHTPRLLESLSNEEVLARIFAADPSEVSATEVLRTARVAIGGTLAAAREALRSRGPAVNLLGGFHHAAPDATGGLCPANDVAVAAAALRHEGFQGRIAVLDLDAHPPDGTARCFEGDPSVWIGSISGVDWGELKGVEETVLPEGSGTVAYLTALEALLPRMPKPALAFVVAGGDVLAGDRMGRLALTLDGVRERDLKLARALEGIPSVWLPGGGYHRDAWKVLAVTTLILAHREDLIQGLGDRDPLERHFRWVSRQLPPEPMESLTFTAEDLEGALGFATPRARRLLGTLNAAAIEYALFRYGILPHLRRLGFEDFRVTLDAAPLGDRVRLHGRYQGREFLLFETVVDRKQIGEWAMLYCHWLTLQDPRVPFRASRPRLPGQEHPGLGLAREAGELLAQLAERLGLDGVVFRPAYFHTAYSARYRMRFVDPERQGRFESLMRDLRKLPLYEATSALSEGRVQMDGKPYAWEADEMAIWLHGPPDDAGRVAAERERRRFQAASGG